MGYDDDEIIIDSEMSDDDETYLIADDSDED